jgi:mono/diheme cytochrome c family protein
MNISILAGSPLAQADTGAALFQQHCSRCHQSATNINSPSDQINNLLKAGTIRQHRFTLDDSTIQNIVTYINQQRS